jgi:hypothetical protein
MEATGDLDNNRKKRRKSLFSRMLLLREEHKLGSIWRTM